MLIRLLCAHEMTKHVCKISRLNSKRLLRKPQKISGGYFILPHPVYGIMNESRPSARCPKWRLSPVQSVWGLTCSFWMRFCVCFTMACLNVLCFFPCFFLHIFSWFLPRDAVRKLGTMADGMCLSVGCIRIVSIRLKISWQCAPYKCSYYYYYYHHKLFIGLVASSF